MAVKISINQDGGDKLIPNHATRKKRSNEEEADVKKNEVMKKN